MASRNRVAPVITIIIVMAALAFIAPTLAKVHADPAKWVTKVVNATKTQKPKIDLKHSIWVNRRSGLYYCRHSKFYGRLRPGFYMSQGNALLKGYRPAEGHTCP